MPYVLCNAYVFHKYTYTYVNQLNDYYTLYNANMFIPQMRPYKP